MSKKNQKEAIRLKEIQGWNNGVFFAAYFLQNSILEEGYAAELLGHAGLKFKDCSDSISKKPLMAAMPKGTHGYLY